MCNIVKGDFMTNTDYSHFLNDYDKASLRKFMVTINVSMPSYIYIKS